MKKSEILGIKEPDFKIAFDFDLTYTRSPKLFARIARALFNEHLGIYIISGRPESQRARTVGEIYQSGIDPNLFSEIFLFPNPYEASAFNDQTLVKIVEWKATKCRELEINMLFEDQSFSIGVLKAISPNTIISLLN
jgi:hypothetical protein